MREGVIARHRTALRVIWGLGVAVVIIGSLLPASSGPLRLLAHLRISDKVIHFFAYAALAFLPAMHERLRTVFGLAVALSAVGVLLEFGQLESPGRSFEVADMLADAAGVLLGVTAGLPWRRRVLGGEPIRRPAPAAETPPCQVR